MDKVPRSGSIEKNVPDSYPSQGKQTAMILNQEVIK